MTVRPIRRIIVHHAGADADAATIDRWHRERGWSGIGYHYVVDPAGMVEEGRQVERAGAHAKGANEDSIGVCMGVDARRGVPGPVWEATVDLVAHLCRRYGLTAAAVYGHREVGTTPTYCPGVDPDTIRAAVAEALGGGSCG